MLDQKFTPDENSVSARPTAMRYGLILGLISVITSIGMMSMDMIDYTGQKSNILSNLLSFGTAIGGLYFAINEHKNNDLGGFISLGRCVKLGLWVGLISGIVNAIGLFVYFQFIAPDYLTSILEQVRDSLEEKGMSADQIDQAMVFLKMSMSPISFSLMSIIGHVIIDVVVAFVLGLIMKKEAATPFN